ncbi:glycoside hydrolase family 2 TIM barrel-domain containing protein [Thalassotalea sp. PS06]|uniref:glycoside hydrolase family 2 TIM barrel-domain containing protein n=1 Tax=Thalassotalea sp. PS06 TaxID=2594005 RepID=UPI0011645947|nr:glycoside hydrolase family 2 TIM barrel-domain containing protein [Thalassotalea sp. PS06]QDP00821.1 cellulase family glycosylhydrolase [Thalassotalea sp. PS06]
MNSGKRCNTRLPILMFLQLLLFAFHGHAKTDWSPKKVEIEKQQNTYQLMVDGQPFTVKGVGLGWNQGKNLEALKAAGGNSFRTWSADNADEILTKAKELGLMVALGFDTEKQLHGFDYNDEQTVREQFERFKTVVDKYKNHPNLLLWVIANEPNLLFAEDGSLAKVNPKVYLAINEMIEYIHKTDPNHPVTYTFAGAIKEHIDVALELTPTVDILSVQVYGDLQILPEAIEEINRDIPVMVTEYGPTGFWEMPTTQWGREIEEPSAVKAKAMMARIENTLVNDRTGKIIGNYAFYWGQKQERTPTWFGMFNKDGSANARVDEMTRFWTGSYPNNRAPLTQSIKLNQQLPQSSVIVAPGEELTADVVVKDPENDDLTHQWRLLTEVTERSDGGAFEQEPQAVKLSTIETMKTKDGVRLSFKAPEHAGEYRLFIYSYDGKGKVGNANFPFKVE